MLLSVGFCVKAICWNLLWSQIMTILLAFSLLKKNIRRDAFCCWWWCKETINSKQFGAKILILYISCDAKTWSFFSYDKECLTGCIFLLSHPSQTNTNVKKKQMLVQQNSNPRHIFRMQSLKVLWGKLPFPPILHHLFSHHCHHPVSKLDIVNIFWRKSCRTRTFAQFQLSRGNRSYGILESWCNFWQNTSGALIMTMRVIEAVKIVVTVVVTLRGKK